MTETRWAIYSKNDSENASHTEHLIFPEPWMQTVAQPGCRIHIPMFKKKKKKKLAWHGSSVIMFAKSGYFLNLKTFSFLSMLLLLRPLHQQGHTICLLWAFVHAPFLLGLFPSQSFPWSGQPLFSPQTSGWTSLLPGSLPWLSCSGLGAHFKSSSVSHFST